MPESLLPFSLIHLHSSSFSLLCLPSLLSPRFPPVLALSAESFYFSLSEWTRPTSPLFNERVVFSCSAHSQNTSFPHFQLAEKGVTLYRKKYTLMRVFKHGNKYIDGNIFAMTALGHRVLCVLRMLNVSLSYWLHISLYHGLISKGWRNSDNCSCEMFGTDLI